MKLINQCLIALFIIVCSGCVTQPHFDLLIKNGQILDGSGGKPYQGDIGINDEKIVAIGQLKNARGKTEIDASNLSVAPGFINMLSWANESLIVDGRSQGDIRQGVTLEVLGEGFSMGPLNEVMKQKRQNNQGHLKYDVAWNTLGEYLQHMEDRGVSTNVASFIGNANLRLHTTGYDTRAATDAELQQMKTLVRQAMEEGAMGMSSALIYAPSSHSDTSELIELAKVVSEYDGMYVSHIRGEDYRLLDSVDELITISREADVRAEIYHFKASGNANWQLLDQAIEKIEKARAGGLAITTDMYMYNASSTGLNILLPKWAKNGGHKKTIKLIEDPRQRKKMINEVKLYLPPENVLFVGFKNKAMRHLIGRTLADVAAERNLSPEETVVTLIQEDDSRIQVVYFSMAKENIRKKLALPYMSICSDAGSYTNEGVFLQQSTHPRAYGSFSRLLAYFVRDEKVISLEEAIHKLTTLPATNLKLKKRGALKEGYFADITVFDANKIQDHATFEKPHQYATGMVHVFVNGTQVLKDGEHTGNKPGKFVRGPGWTGK